MVNLDLCCITLGTTNIWHFHNQPCGITYTYVMIMLKVWWQYLKVWCYLNKIINMIMLIIYNELLMTNHSIRTSFVRGFQLSNKKSLYYTYLKYH
jgi:hypothetical protein